MSRRFNIQQRLTILDQACLVQYLQDIRQFDVLTKSEEVALFNEYNITSDKKIKDKIVNSNLRWVVSVAKQYVYPKARLEDIINEGNLGLIMCVDTFDVTRGIRFITYATNYIKLQITSYCNNTLPDITQPANRPRLNKMVKKSIIDLKLLGQDNPSDEQIVEYYMIIKESTDLKLTTVLLNEVRNNSKPAVSMHSSVSDTDCQLELADTFKASAKWSADYELNKEENNSEIFNSLSNILNERETNVVCMSFGLNGEETYTLEQIGYRLGYTRERIGQILKQSVDELKNHKDVFGPILGVSKDTAHLNESNHMKFT